MNLFLPQSIKRFTEYKSLAEKAFSQLQASDFHFSPDPGSNSIAVIIQHMHGNMLSRWTNFLTEDGEKTWRKRDGEFVETQLNRAELMALWNQGWQVLLETLQSLQEEDLSKNITIRSQPLQVMDAILRQLAHYSYHVGQIVYLSRLIRKDAWQSLSIPRGGSDRYNNELQHK